MAPPFGQRLVEAMATRGQLCVGIDPHPGLLTEWGLPGSADGLERFALTCVEALAGDIAVLKPQSAFFESYGSRGIAVLERVVQESQQAGALVLLDVKRGDIGSTMSAYAAAYLADGAPLAVDAVTASPYLGVDALAPAFDLADQTGRGVFVLARTSNPEGSELQHAVTAGGSVAQIIVGEVARRNAGSGVLGSHGVVVGATISQLDLDLATLNGPILAPGLGAQGATVQELRRLFGSAWPTVLPSSSRDVLKHGPAPEALRAAALRVRDAIAESQ